MLYKAKKISMLWKALTLTYGCQNDARGKGVPITNIATDKV